MERKSKTRPVYGEILLAWGAISKGAALPRQQAKNQAQEFPTLA